MKTFILICVVITLAYCLKLLTSLLGMATDSLEVKLMKNYKKSSYVAYKIFCGCWYVVLFLSYLFVFIPLMMQHIESSIREKHEASNKEYKYLKKQAADEAIKRDHAML